MKLQLPRVKKKSYAGTRRITTQVFADKIVSSRKEPTLFNICSAQMSMLVSTGPFTNLGQLRKNIPRDSRRNVMASDVLQMMNVALSELPAEFSLLRTQTDKPALKDPYIVDFQDYEMTVNNVIEAGDKFPSVADPFYQLDDGLNSGASYRAPKSPGGTIEYKPDLSCIASNMTVLNQDDSVFGKNKYF